MGITTEFRKRVFISYSHDDHAHAEALYKHLAEFRRMFSDQAVFYDKVRIEAGDIWSDVLAREVEEADFFILLISQNYLNSYICMEQEAGRALQRHLNNQAQVFVVLLRECIYKKTSPKAVEGRRTLGDLNSALKGDDNRDKPVEEWKYRDRAWTQVVGKIYEHYRIQAGPATPASLASLAPGPAQPESREKLLGLLYRCDRIEQSEALDDRLGAVPSLTRPFLMIACGCDEDRPKQLVNRFHQVNIPEYLRSRGIHAKHLLEVGELPARPLTGQADVPEAYAQRFFRKAGWAAPSAAGVGSQLAADPRPKFFYRIVMTDDSAEAEAYRRQLGEFLSALPDMPADRPLFVLLFFKHGAAKVDEFRERFGAAGAALQETGSCPLPQLAAVRKREIDDWFNEFDVAIAELAEPEPLKNELFRRHDEQAAAGGLRMADVIGVVEARTGIKTNIV